MTRRYINCSDCGSLIGIDLNPKADAFYMDGNNRAICPSCLQEERDQRHVLLSERRCPRCKGKMMAGKPPHGERTFLACSDCAYCAWSEPTAV